MAAAKTTTTVEKLFAQILERKKRIIEQAKHQTDLFDHFLASNCILDGIPPPSFLFSPSSSSFPSHPSELKKEELISGILLTQSQSTSLYSSYDYSLFHKPIIPADNGIVPNDSYMELRASDKDNDKLSMLPQIMNLDTQCNLNVVPELDWSVKSPQNCADASTLDKFLDHPQSLAKIQRSKSRQRALELRNSAKETKSRSCDERKDGAYNGRIASSGIISLQHDLANESVLPGPVDAKNGICTEEEAKIDSFVDRDNRSEVSRGRAMNDRLYNQQMGSVNEPGNTGGNPSNMSVEDGLMESVIGLLQQSSHVNGASGVVKLSDIDNANSASEKTNVSSCRGNEMSTNISSGGIKTSGICNLQRSIAEEHLDIGNSSCVAKIDSGFGESSGKLLQQPNCVGDLSLEPDNPSSIIAAESYGVGKSKVGDNQSNGMESKTYSGRITRSRGPSKQVNCVDVSLKLESAYSRGDKDDVSTGSQQLNHVDELGESIKPYDIADREGGVGVCDAYSDSIERSSSSSQKFIKENLVSKLSNFFNVEKDTDHRLASFGKSTQLPQTSNLDGVEGFGLQEVLGTQANALSCAESSDAFDMERREAVAPGTDTDSDRAVEACSVTSVSNLYSGGLGVEPMVSRLSTECPMLVESRQLDFGKIQECSLDETSGPVLHSVKQDVLLERQPSTLLHSTKLLENSASVCYREKPDSFKEIRLLGEQEDLSKEEKHRKHFEAHIEKFVPSLDGSMVNPLQQKMNTVRSENQNADSYFTGSGHQAKRLKTGVQLTAAHSFSSKLIKPLKPIHTDHVSRNINAADDKWNAHHKFKDAHICQVGDAVKLNVGESPVHGMPQHVEHGMTRGSEFSLPMPEIEQAAHNLEMKDRNLGIGFILMHEQPGVPSPSPLTQLAAGSSRDDLLGRTEEPDPASLAPGARGLQRAEQNVILSQSEDESELKTTEQLSYTGNMKSRSHSRENENLSYYSVGPPHSPSMQLTGTDQNMPEFEGFVMETDGEQPCGARQRIDLEKLKLPSTALERASVLEQLCKSACLHTPVSQFSHTYQLHETLNLYQSMPNGILEGMELKSALDKNDDNVMHPEVSSNCFNEEPLTMFCEKLPSDCLPFYNDQTLWDVMKPYVSPVGKLWDGTTSKSGSSEKQASSILELPCISEENENIDDVVSMIPEGNDSELMPGSVKREPLADITTNSNLLTSICEAEKHDDRSSLASVNMEFSFTSKSNRTMLKVGNKKGKKKGYSSNPKEKLGMSVRVNGSKRVNGSLHDRFSKPSGRTGLRKNGPSLSERESKPNNIVSNITSFVPLVQQKQAASLIAGKRDVKVKALEAAEAAKRLAEKKENERKLRKEALKLERAKLEEQNLRQLEMEKERKEEERKKKQAEMEAKKRQREEQEKKEKEVKRKRLEDGRRQQLERGGNLCAEKEEKDKCRDADEKACGKNLPKDKSRQHEKKENAKRDENLQKGSDNEPRTVGVSTIDSQKASIVPEDLEGVSYSGEDVKMMGHFEAIQSDNLISNASLEQSYEISPYKGSDDEDEDEDEDIPTSKFTPSWASKSQLAQIVSVQQAIDPESIFPPESFCSIAEVLLPRKLQQKQQAQQ